MQLALQCLQLRFGEPRFELGRRDGALLRLAVIVERVGDGDDGPVGHHLPVEVEEEALAHHQPPLHLAIRHPAQDVEARGHGHDCVREGGHEHAAHVGRHGAQPAVPFESEPARHPEHEGREQRPRVPVGKVQRQQDAEGFLALAEERDVVERLQRGEPAQRRRHAQNHERGAAFHRQVHLGTIGPVGAPVKLRQQRARAARSHTPVIDAHQVGLEHRPLAPAGMSFVPGTKIGGAAVGWAHGRREGRVGR